MGVPSTGKRPGCGACAKLCQWLARMPVFLGDPGAARCMLGGGFWYTGMKP